MAPFGTIYTWGPGNPRVARATAIANLNGLEISVPEFSLQTDRTPEWYAKFPLGKVPAFESASGDVLLTETLAITHYLALSGPRSHQLLGRTPAESAQIQQWTAHAEVEFWPPIQIFNQILRGFRPADDAVIAENKGKIARALEYAEKILEGRKWIAGTEEITVADVSLASVLNVAFKAILGKEERKYPKVLEWFERVTDVEEVKRAFGERVYKE
ncbi:putative translation elongation factor eEF-1B gamma subunit [Ascodesmis nigricans]|uniref:Putative translation elongation factor eEF-1B gamma subunit n=1 Tax=Ascodesmis nigricans TaxID=341454 RepID=A0A4S2MQQ0_9PEZI|nr:putative translation elongation factor eEF-1B gamma subunit [Ascodesmis nigricans]